MENKKQDIQADILLDSLLKDIDRSERTSIMEPLLIASDCRQRGELTDLAFELATKSAGLRRSLPQGILIALTELMRAMNCYYSNLIEGHNTHPVDIERALKGNYSTDKNKRNLQLEAEAHISVQKWIDEGGLSRRALRAQNILAIHKKFCELLPDDLLWLKDPETGKKAKVIPGELRKQDVKVGQHVAISPGAIPRFLKRFEDVYSQLSKSEMILASAAAHHRLLWIHPFLDGNGRVARLASYAQFIEALDTAGIWSIARGLARNDSEYKRHLIACDQSRYNSFDGRGNLSEKALIAFTEFFLKTCIDQVNFMENLIEPNALHKRIILWAKEEMDKNKLPTNSGLVLEAVLYRGELPRADVADLLRLSDRQGRRIISALISYGILSSKTDRAPLHLVFPAALAPQWLPGLFPGIS